MSKGVLSDENLTQTSIIVFSDIGCPWCYIAHRELQKAIREAADWADAPKINVEHRPFLLRPLLDEDTAFDRKTWYFEKFGKENFEQIQSTIVTRAREVGIDISFQGWATQTIRAHRLAQKAYELGGSDLQTKYLDAIFYAQFTEGKNVSDVEVLGEIAWQVGMMPTDQAIDFLRSSEYQSEVVQMAVDARRNGVTGVPFTIFNGRWAVSGCQSTEDYAAILCKLLGKTVSHIPSTPVAAESRGKKPGHLAPDVMSS